MADQIRHQGTVIEINGNCVKVKITQMSACSTCSIKGHCNASESKDKIVEVYGCRKEGLRNGDCVTIIAANKTGYYAVILSSIVPLVLLVATLVIVLLITGNEATAALSGIAMLLPYYMVLYMLRDKIRTRMSFKIE
ncbi:MAG: SoxR reducing system RseC family protein [Prevotella sp.]